MIENKVALVTGVSSGIGREIAQLLAERGARVFGTVRDHRSTASVAWVELIHMDVTNDGSVAEAVQSLLLRAGEIHALVNNAGYALLGGLEETSLSEAQQQFDTNFFGVLRVTQAVLPSMRRLGYGRIVNISSILGLLRGLTWAFTPPANMRWRATPGRWITRSGHSASGLCWSNPLSRKPTSRGTARPPCLPWMLMRIKENESSRSFSKKSPVGTSLAPWQK